MFISDAEAARRINSSQNILSVIKSGSPDSDPPAAENEPPAVIPDEILPPEPEKVAQTAETAESQVTLTDKTIRKLLGLDLGRRRGEANMPVELRAATAVCAELVNTKTAAQTFGTSYHHADELKHGHTCQEHRYGGYDKDPDLEAEVDRQKKTVRNLAFDKLTKTLGLISDEKLEAVTDALKLSRISRDLSAVVEKVLPKDQVQFGGVHFHVWKPEMQEETAYEVVVVGNQS